MLPAEDDPTVVAVAVVDVGVVIAAGPPVVAVKTNLYIAHDITANNTIEEEYNITPLLSVCSSIILIVY